MMKPKFSVSLMCMDFLDIRRQIEVLNRRADMFHADIMDGHFCRNITLSPDLVRAFHSVAELPIDVHLMTTRPNDWIDGVAEAGADCISVHAETVNADAFRTLRRIEGLGCRRGVVLNPATPLSYIQHYMELLDILTVMTVDVGYAGQAFIGQMLPKIEAAREWKEKRGYRCKIQIDGACNADTFRRLTDAGAEVLILGTSGLFCYNEDLDLAFDAMLAAFSRATEGARGDAQ